MKVHRCFLVLVDLLGFSTVVMAEGAEGAVPMVRRFQRLTRSIVRELNAQRSVHGLDRGRRSQIRVFSDLVIVHSEGDSHDDCMDILELSSKLFRLGCEEGLLPRGAISWGEMVTEPGVTVGQPLVEAHRLEVDQEWAGIALCDSMELWDKEGGLTGDWRATILGVAEERQWVVRWPVPTKAGPPAERLAVNWLAFEGPPFWHTGFCGDPGSASDPGVREKLKHTEAFYHHLVQLKEA